MTRLLFLQRQPAERAYLLRRLERRYAQLHLNSRSCFVLNRVGTGVKMRAPEPSQAFPIHPRNPLGVRAMYLGNTTYRIHGTDAPWTVGQQVSHGCIRMFNDDVIDLYQRTPIGSSRIVAW